MLMDKRRATCPPLFLFRLRVAGGRRRPTAMLPIESGLASTCRRTDLRAHRHQDNGIIVQHLEHGYTLLRDGRFEAAVEHARALLASHPDDAAVLVFASEAQLASGNSADALSLITRAITASNGNSALKLKKASLLAHLRYRSEAIATASEAAEQHPGDGRIQWQAGTLINHCNRPGLALEYYGKARAVSGGNPSLLYDTAVAQFFTGDFDGAEANLDQLLSHSPQAGHALYLRSTLRRQSAERNHVRDLEDRLAAGFDQREPEAATLYALSKELEDLGEHPRAFSTLSRAAATKRGTLKYDVASEVASLQALMEAYTADAMAAPSGGHDEPGAIFIVGMPRTGTTLVERLLVQQESVKSAGELLDFGNLVALSTQRILDSGVGGSSAMASLRMDFAALGKEYMRGAREAAMGSATFVDKMPVNYLYAGLIRKALPQARIIHLRRDPLDCCYAVYKTLFFNAYHFSYDLSELAEYYIAYDRLMRHWHDVMPGAILDVSYEALVDDTEAQARRILDWCGLPWNPAVLAPPRDAPFATASASQVREPIHRRSVQSSRRHIAELSPLVSRLGQAGIELG